MEVWSNIIGWLSASALLITLVAQIVTQWRDRTSKGVSRWLFIGQVTASVGFIIYSVLVNNTIFIVTNCLIAGVALFGQYTYYRNRRATKS
jgi:uncharacterized protein with PQ loop repeat